jgi:hypothetical protein
MVATTLAINVSVSDDQLRQVVLEKIKNDKEFLSFLHTSLGKDEVISETSTITTINVKYSDIVKGDHRDDHHDDGMINDDRESALGEDDGMIMEDDDAKSWTTTTTSSRNTQKRQKYDPLAPKICRDYNGGYHEIVATWYNDETTGQSPLILSDCELTVVELRQRKKDLCWAMLNKIRNNAPLPEGVGKIFAIFYNYSRFATDIRFICYNKNQAVKLSKFLNNHDNIVAMWNLCNDNV